MRVRTINTRKTIPAPSSGTQRSRNAERRGAGTLLIEDLPISKGPIQFDQRHQVCAGNRQAVSPDCPIRSVRRWFGPASQDCTRGSKISPPNSWLSRGVTTTKSMP